MSYISYSGFKKYSECPRSYWHGYIDKTPLPKPENKVGALYGSVIGTLFELFYRENMSKNRKLKDVEVELAERAPRVMDEVMAKERQRGTFDWKESKEFSSHLDVLRLVVKTIPVGLTIIQHHRLVGSDAEAEVKLDSKVDGHIIGGRADFIMTRIVPHNDLVILDGKGSRHREKYVDVKQLQWYAVLYREKHGRLPDKLAFVFWRGADPEHAVDWHPVREEDINRVREEALSVCREIGKSSDVSAFPSKPSSDNCKFCPFVFTCEGGQHQRGKSIPPVGVTDVSM